VLSEAARGCSAAEEEDSARGRSTARLVTYLITSLLKVGERNLVETGGSTKAKRGGGKKKASKKGEEVTVDSGWKTSRTELLDALLHVSGGGITRFWPGGVCEQDFWELFSRASCMMLEGADSSKDASVRGQVANILDIASQRFPGFRDAVSSAVIASVKSNASGTAAIVEACTLNEELGSAVISELIRAVGTTSGKDSSGMRNVSQLLTDVCKARPSTALANFGSLSALLENPSYSVRTAVVVAGQAVLTSCFQSAGNADEEEQERRQQAQDTVATMLVDRCRDSNAFTRAAAVRAVGAVIESSLLPPDALAKVTQGLAARLVDKSAVVRKAAAAALTLALENNPFGSALSPEVFEAGQKEAMLWISQHAPEEVCASVGVERSETATAPEGEDEIQNKLRFLEFCQAALRFCDVMEQSVPQAVRLLGSTTTGDVVEAVKLLIRCQAFGVSGSSQSQRAMFSLVWSTEAGIRASAVDAFRELFLEKPVSNEAAEDDEDDDDAAASSEDSAGERQTAMNLVKLLQQCDVATAACVREILRELVSSGQILPGVVRRLWELVMKAVRAQLLANSCEDGERDKASRRLYRTLPPARGAMMTLDMVASAAPEVIDQTEAVSRLASVLAAPRLALSADRDVCLTDTSKASVARGDYRLARFACACLSKFRSHDNAVPGSAHAANAALPASKRGGKTAFVAGPPGSKSHDELLASRVKAAGSSVQHICAMLRGDWDAWGVSDCRHFYAAAREGVRAIFALSPQPERVSAALLREMLAKVLGGTASASGRPQAIDRVLPSELARVVFVAGEVAIALLVHAEEVASALKKCRSLAAEYAEASAGKTTGGSKEASQRVRDDLEAQLGGVGGGGDPARDPDEIIAAIASNGIVAKDLLGALGKVVVQVVSTHGMSDTSASGEEETLLRCGVSTLCKFMAISAPFCEEHLPLLFTLLDRTPLPSLRGTIAIALGDLSLRHPNLVEPWTDNIYARLRDSDTTVRRSTLMVLTHLILNDMVKVRGQIGEIACKLEDPVPDIRQVAQTFFTELSKRNNAPIYNLMPDILSTVVTRKDIDPAGFKSIMKFLLGFIAKDKQVEALTEKLAQRFHACTDPEAWRAFAFCIAQLSHTPKSIAKLTESLPLMRTAVGDATVFKHLSSVGSKSGKAASSVEEGEASAGATATSEGDSKASVADFVSKLTKLHAEQSESDTLASEAALATTKSRRRAKPLQKSKPRARKAKAVVESDDEGEECVEEL
jgi:condensin complex subunit 1